MGGQTSRGSDSGDQQSAPAYPGFANPLEAAFNELFGAPITLDNSRGLYTLGTGAPPQPQGGGIPQARPVPIGYPGGTGGSPFAQFERPQSGYNARFFADPFNSRGGAPGFNDPNPNFGAAGPLDYFLSGGAGGYGGPVSPGSGSLGFNDTGGYGGFGGFPEDRFMGQLANQIFFPGTFDVLADQMIDTQKGSAFQSAAESGLASALGMYNDEIDPMLREGVSTGFRTDIDPIRQEELRRYREETIPGLQEQFASTTGPFSSDFNSAMIREGGAIHSELGALQTQLDEAAAGRRLEAGSLAGLLGPQYAQLPTDIGQSILDLRGMSQARELAERPGGQLMTFLSNLSTLIDPEAVPQGNVSAGSNTGQSKTKSGGVLSGSTIRIKDDVDEVEEIEDAVLRLRPVSYIYKPGFEGNDKPGATRYGLIAEEVAEVLPDLVRFDDEGEALGVVYQDLVAPLIKVCQTQQVQITRLSERLDELETG